MRTRRSPWYFSFIACALVLTACTGGDGGRSSALDAVTEEDRYGGTAVVGSIVDLQSMNSLTTNETYSRLVQREVLFMPLLAYDAALEPVPWLAERWDTARVAADTLELTFRLRQDVSWHDGRPTTAEDVLFSFQRVLDPEVGSSLASGFALYSPRAVLVDPRTIRFRLRAHADFLDG
jgi:peptide/nickel transport system substrate-binding protein